MTEALPRYICIHGHFYQPPRENPWLEAIEPQESALPFRDWNERITHECYAPNARARLLDEQGRLRDVMNTYEHISFNFGPTLLSWLDEHAPKTYEAIIRADAMSRSRRSGHGNALAQPYNHLIMPLASPRDKVTQVVWGMEDFRKRFDRDPEGMWLPETAVDLETLDVLARHGIRFTVLSPTQADSYRDSAHGQWITGDIDPSRPYLCRLPHGRSIVIFFYDGPISRAIAFEQLLNSGEELCSRLLGAFSAKRSRPQLVHIATDGESYGHHHRFGEMALAYTLDKLLRHPHVRLTNYGEFLDLYPPSAEVRIKAKSSWSCAHGVGRWAEDCGCSVEGRPGWNQRWRAPLREALNLLRDRVDRIFGRKGAEVLRDPWEARNAYIDVILERHEGAAAFLHRHENRPLSPSEQLTALALLEMQRNRMLMYTSCGWFFDDITGIEALQILRYAARVLQLAKQWDAKLADLFLERLSEAVSNVHPNLTGNELFTAIIMPQVADLSQVAAHVAMASVFEDMPLNGSFFCYDIALPDSRTWEVGERRLMIGRMSVHRRATMDQRDFVVAVLYLGGLDFRCSVREWNDLPDDYPSVRSRLSEVFQRQSSTELIRLMDTFFPGKHFSLKDLFAESRGRIIESVTRRMFGDQATLLDTFYRKTADLASLIMDYGGHIPDTFRAAAGFALHRGLHGESEKLAKGQFPNKLKTVVQEARFWGISLDTGPAEGAVNREIVRLTRELADHPRDKKKVAVELVKLIDLAREVEVPLHLGEAQVELWEILRTLREEGIKEVSAHLVELASRLAVRISEDEEDDLNADRGEVEAAEE